MTKTLAVIALVFALAASSAVAAPQCKTGKACGNSCIAATKTCSITPPKAPQCKTGVACGNTCIAKGKVCHIPPK